MSKELFIILMLFLPSMAWADKSGTCGYNLTWTYVEATQTLTISGKGAMNNYDNDFYSSSKTPWYSYRSDIKTLVIESGVTSIGDYAFAGCTGLTSVIIPNSVTSIGYDAFYGCSGLTSITIPNSVTSIGKWAFSSTGWYNAQPDGILYLDNWLIGYKRNVPTGTLFINDGTSGIADRAFEDCSGLTSVTIPNSVTSIGYDAFYGCSGLTSVIIPNSVTSIGESAFWNCSGLTSVTFHCKVIGYWFNGKSSIKEVIIGDEVTSIGGSAFAGCTGLTSVIIPNSVTSIGDYAFSGCSGLTSVTIPNSVTSIGYDAFYGCSGLTSVIIPNSVTSIGESAFQSCSGLTSVVIGSGVTSIGWNAFYSTNLKKTIWLTNTPPSGASYASSSMNYVSNNQFKFNNQVVYPFLSSYFDVDGIRYVPVSPSERTCDAIDCTYDNSITYLTIPSSVTNQGITLTVQKVQPLVCCANQYIENLTCNINSDIPDYAFSGCKNMKSVTLGDNITSIGNYAFQNCSSLLSVVIPNAVTSIGTYSFSSCSSLTKMTLGSKVNTIGEYALQYCSLLSELRIPKSVKEINYEVFRGCKGLKEFFIEDRTEELILGSSYDGPLFSDCPLDYVYIGGDISYRYSPFSRNISLRTVVITDKETEISEKEFYGCTNLQSFTIGDGVTTFGDWAFSGCQSLKSLSFGSHLKTIGKEAFSDCTSVTEITSKVATPPSCGDQALDDINKWNCKLYVPQGSMSAYQGADQWKEFFFIAEGEGGGTPVNPDGKKCATPTISYSNGKLTFNSATDGAVCQSTITDSDITSYSSNEVQLGVTYNISVYATKDGYENSDVATATLCWIDVEPSTEGIANGVASVRANAVLIQGESGTFSISGADEGTPISIYNTAGQMVGSAKANAETTHVFTTLRKGEIGIVRMGQKAVKVVVK